MARIIQFFDGATSALTPVIGNIEAADLVDFADDATYEAANVGAPFAGNIYFNTTDATIRYYDGATWIEVGRQIDIQANTDDIADIRTTTGTADGETNMSTYTGALINDNESTKQNIQQVETAVESNTQEATDLRSTSGTSNGETDMGTYSGSIISDNETTKENIQELETAVQNIPAGLVPQGSWNADTNTPTLVSSTGTEGHFYIVSVAGSTNLDGITDWGVNDWAVFAGGTWNKLDHSDQVSSVFGRNGAVVAATNDYTWNQIDKTVSTIDDIADVDTSTTAPTDGQVLTYNDGNSEWEPQDSQGGSGQGGINYILNPQAEDNLDDVTVSSGNISKTAETLAAIRGDQSFKFVINNTASSADYIEFDFTGDIDLMDVGKTNFVNFDYRTSSNFDSLGTELQVVLRNVDTSSDVDVTGGIGDGIIGGTNEANKRFTGVINFNSTDNTYKMRINVNNEPTSGDVSITIDNISVGPDKILDTVVTATIDESVAAPSLTLGTEVTDLENLKLTGSRTAGVYSLGVQFNFDLVTGNNFDSLTVDIVNDFAFLAGKTITSIHGSFGTNVNSSTAGQDYVNGYFVLNGTELGVNFNGDFVAANDRLANGNLMIFVEEDDNQGAIFSDKELLNTPVKVRAFRSVTQSIPTGSATTVVWDDVSFDDGGHMNTSTGIFTSPETGVIRFSSKVIYANTTAWSVGNAALIRILKNGTTYSTFTNDAEASTGSNWNKGLSISGLIDVQKGDTLEIELFQASGSSINIEANTNSDFSLEYVPDFTFLAAFNTPDKIQTFFLASDKTTSQTLTDLSISNLVVGRWYNAKGKFQLNRTANGTATVKAIHDSNTLDLAITSGVTSGPLVRDVIDVDFQATATTLTFVYTIGGTSTVFGNNTVDFTYLRAKKECAGYY